MELAVADRMFRVFGWAMIAFTILGLIVAGFLTARETPVYESGAKVIVKLQTDGTPSPNDLVNANNFARAKAATFAQVVSSSQVLQPVIAQMGLDVTAQELSRRVSGSTEPESVIVGINVEASSPEDAAALGAAVTQRFIEYIETDLEKPAPGAKTSVTIDLFQEATTPESPSSPKVANNLGLGLVGGLLVGAVVALVLAISDRRLRSVGDIERVIGRPVLGVVGRAGGARRATGLADSITVGEPLRAIRTNLTFVGSRGEGMTFAVASARSDENSTAALLGVAKAFAEIGAKVVVIDANFAAPKAAVMFRVSRSIGLIDALVSNAKVSDIAVATNVSGLDVIPPGNASIDTPSRLLGTIQMKQLVDELAATYDVVLFDVAPLLVAADAAMLSSLTDGVVLVAGAGRVNSAELSSAIDILTNLEVPVTGVIVTKWSLGREPKLAMSSEAVTRVMAESSAPPSSLGASTSAPAIASTSAAIKVPTSAATKVPTKASTSAQARASNSSPIGSLANAPASAATNATT